MDQADIDKVIGGALFVGMMIAFAVYVLIDAWRADRRANASDRTKFTE